MAGPFYVDLGGTWATAQTGLNHTGDEWEGPYGFQEAVDTAVAGETVYAKGTATMCRLGTLTGCDDMTATWSIGDDVQNDNDFGSARGTLWNGILCEITATTMVIELDIGEAFVAVSSSDGIYNTTQSAGADFTGDANIPIDFDTNSGDTTSAEIKYIGLTAAWAENGTRCVFDGTSVTGTTDLFAGGGTDYLWYENIELDNSPGAGIKKVSGYIGHVFMKNVYIHDCSGHGLSGGDYTNTRMIQCRFEGNQCGIGSIYGGGCAIACVFADNTDDGLNQYQDLDVVIGCVFHNNGQYGAESEADMVAAHCVFDANGDAGLLRDGYGGIAFACRFTNHNDAGDYGIEKQDAAAWNWEYYCYYEDNATNRDTTTRQLKDGGVVASDEDNADTNEGYTNDAADDFNLRTDASLQNVALELDG